MLQALQWAATVSLLCILLGQTFAFLKGPAALRLLRRCNEQNGDTFAGSSGYMRALRTLLLSNCEAGTLRLTLARNSGAWLAVFRGVIF